MNKCIKQTWAQKAEWMEATNHIPLPKRLGFRDLCGSKGGDKKKRTPLSPSLHREWSLGRHAYWLRYKFGCLGKFQSSCSPVLKGWQPALFLGEGKGEEGSGWASLRDFEFLVQSVFFISMTVHTEKVFFWLSIRTAAVSDSTWCLAVLPALQIWFLPMLVHFLLPTTQHPDWFVWRCTVRGGDTSGVGLLAGRVPRSQRPSYGSGWGVCVHVRVSNRDPMLRSLSNLNHFPKVSLLTTVVDLSGRKPLWLVYISTLLLAHNGDWISICEDLEVTHASCICAQYIFCK
jgi:hypothetical protein